MKIEDLNKPIAKNISRIIEDKGLKKRYVAEKAGYTKQEFSDMLNGRRIIKACDIPRIARATDADLYEIYAEEEKGTRKSDNKG